MGGETKGAWALRGDGTVLCGDGGTGHTALCLRNCTYTKVGGFYCEEIKGEKVSDLKVSRQYMWNEPVYV